jgi:hypothetical protein
MYLAGSCPGIIYLKCFFHNVVSITKDKTLQKLQYFYRMPIVSSTFLFDVHTLSQGF